jgi:hypothetical protein
MKEATRDLYPYEYVFYTSRARSHEGNHYEFEFPGSWRTKTGGDLILAIRGIHLKKATRSFELKNELYDYTNNPTTHVFSFEFTYAFGQNSTIADMLTELNAQWRRQLSQADEDEDTGPWYDKLVDGNVHWRLNVKENRIELLGTDNMLHNDLSFENHFDPNQSEIFQSENLHKGHQFPIWPPGYGAPAFCTWNRQDLLVQADFITQADNQHLGYTDSEYSIFKEYEIKKNTPYFTISLFEDETMKPLSLPSDNKDYVVIEAVISRKYEL